MIDKKYYKFKLFYKYNKTSKCNKINNGMWLYIIDYYINNYNNKNKICTLRDSANTQTFTFCNGLNKLYTSGKLKQDKFINILLKIFVYEGIISNLYNLSEKMIFESGLKFYEKYGYMTCIDDNQDEFNYHNYYNSLLYFINDITNRKILITTPLDKIINIIKFISKIRKQDIKTDRLDFSSNYKSLNNIPKFEYDTKTKKTKKDYYSKLNNNEKTIYDLIDNKNNDLDIEEIYKKYYTLYGYIEYFKLVNKSFMDDYLKQYKIINMQDMYKFSIYLIDNLNKLFDNINTITYNDYYRYTNIIESFIRCISDSLSINDIFLNNYHIKYYNTCNFFIDMGNNKYVNFDKHVAMIHQKIKGVNSYYISPDKFTTPPLNELKKMIADKEAVIFTQIEANDKLNTLTTKLLNYYKLN